MKNVTSGAVGKPVTFLVETSQAGPGNLEVSFEQSNSFCCVMKCLNSIQI